MAPRAHSGKIQQPVKPSKNHNPRANRTIHGRKFDADGNEVKKIIAHAEGPVIERWLQATCLRCLQAHLPEETAPNNNGKRSRFWCTQRPATRRERNLFIKNLKNLGEMDAAAEMEAREEERAASSPAQRHSLEALRVSSDKTEVKSINTKPTSPLTRKEVKELSLPARKDTPPRKDPSSPTKESALDAAAAADLKRKEANRAARRELRAAINNEDAIELARDRTATFPSDMKLIRQREPYLDVDAMLTLDDIRYGEFVFPIKEVARKKRGKKAVKAVKTEEYEGLDEDEYEIIEDEDEEWIEV